MFLVFNKGKISSYLVALSTVIILFVFAIGFYHIEQDPTISTSSYPARLLPIYSVQTQEKKIALTMNCAWNSDDIDSILSTLEKYQVKITFFVVGDWVDKYPDALKKMAKAGHEIRQSF